MWKRLKSWWDADLAAQHLEHLDDRLLADMGVERDGLRDRVMGRNTDPVVLANAPCACRPASAPVQG